MGTKPAVALTPKELVFHYDSALEITVTATDQDEARRKVTKGLDSKYKIIVAKLDLSKLKLMEIEA